jgi:hypothetical protein
MAERIFIPVLPPEQPRRRPEADLTGIDQDDSSKIRAPHPIKHPARSRLEGTVLFPNPSRVERKASGNCRLMLVFHPNPANSKRVSRAATGIAVLGIDHLPNKFISARSPAKPVSIIGLFRAVFDECFSAL